MCTSWGRSSESSKSGRQLTVGCWDAVIELVQNLIFKQVEDALHTRVIARIPVAIFLCPRPLKRKGYGERQRVSVNYT
jgi:hypothetical protein